MTTAARIIQIAATQIGTIESPRDSNRTKYGAWYGMNGVPYCDIFVSWVFAWAGAPALAGGKFAYTPYHVNWFKKNHQWYSSPRAGDLVFYSWMGSVAQHVGIVERVLPGGYIQTIEGNTSPSNAGSQNNGGGVYRRVRSRFGVLGFARPAYSNSTPVPRPPAPPSRSSRTSTVSKRLQLAVRVSPDGRWGPATQAALLAVIHKNLGHGVKYLQARVGATQDGQWGPASERARLNTIGRIQVAIGVKPDQQWGPITNGAFSRAYNANYGK